MLKQCNVPASSFIATEVYGKRTFIAFLTIGPIKEIQRTGEVHVMFTL
jgi:hypothetical protein